MGGKSQTTTNKTEIPKAVQQSYNALMDLGFSQAAQPLQQYNGPTVAGFNPTQTNAFNAVDQAQGVANPFINAASQYATQSAQPTYSQIPQWNQASIDQYSSPYTQDVINATLANINLTNQQQQNDLLGRSIQAGNSPGYGDRTGLAAAELARNQALASNQTIAGLENQGYQSALGAFQNQQGLALSGLNADSSKAAQASQLFSSLGSQAQQSALSGANAELQIGNQQQQQSQQQLTDAYNQFQQQQQYPYQQLQFLSGLVTGTGPLYGNTQTTTQPAPSGASQVLGGLTALGGLFGLKHGGGVKRYDGGGSVAAPVVAAPAHANAYGIDTPMLSLSNFMPNGGTPINVPQGNGYQTGDQTYINALPRLSLADMPPPTVTQLPKSFLDILSYRKQLTGPNSGDKKSSSSSSGNSRMMAQTYPDDDYGEQYRWNPLPGPNKNNSDDDSDFTYARGGAPSGRLRRPRLPLGRVGKTGHKPGTYHPEGGFKNSLSGLGTGPGIPAALPPNMDAPIIPAMKRDGGVASLSDIPVHMASGGLPDIGTGIGMPRKKGLLANADLPLLYMGLGIMGGQSPSAGVNIGQGALSGLQAAQAAQKDDKPYTYEQNGTVWFYYPSSGEKFDTGMPAKPAVGEVPSGYRSTASGDLEAIPGGPAAKPGESWSIATPDQLKSAGLPDGTPAQVSSKTGEMKLLGSGALGGSGTSQDVVTQIADGVISGQIPPDLKGFYKYKPLVAAELAKRGYNLSDANLDFASTSRLYSTMNGPQQTRIRQGVTQLDDTMPGIRDLAEKWNASGFPLLNKAQLVVAQQGGLGPDAQKLATLLDQQISLATSELASVLMGGNSPTDHAFESAGRTLSADWSYPQLTAALDQIEKNLEYRKSSLAQVTAGFPDSKYNHLGADGALVPDASDDGTQAPAPASVPAVPTSPNGSVDDLKKKYGLE